MIGDGRRVVVWQWLLGYGKRDMSKCVGARQHGKRCSKRSMNFRLQIRTEGKQRNVGQIKSLFSLLEGNEKWRL